MKRAFVADTHVTDRHDPAYEKILAFLRSQIEIQTDEIFLMGDIFDYMCGCHEEYLIEFHEFFFLLGEIAKKKKKVYYLEGNHDIHLSRLFVRFQEKEGICVGQIIVCPGPMRFASDGRRWYVSHGDELAIDDRGYQLYRRIIRSRLVELFIDAILPHRQH